MKFKKKFKIILEQDNHIVKDHRVHDVRILPGVALVEIIYRLLEDQFPSKQIILRNILFKEPIAVSDQFDQKILLFVEEKNGHFAINIKSQRLKDKKDVGKLKEVAECFLYLEEFKLHDERADLLAIKKHAVHSFDMDGIYSNARDMSIVHHEFMKALGTVYQTETEMLMDITVSDLAKNYLDRFYVHPAFLDAATFCIGIKEIDKPYIPMFIREFKALKNGFDRCYVKATLIAENGKAQDTITNNVRSYDESGSLLFSMEGLTLKCIRDASLIQRLISFQSDEEKENIEIIPSKKIISNSSSNLSIATNNIEDYIKNKIAVILQKPAVDINSTANFYDLGLDSTQLLGIVRNFEAELSTKLYPTLLFEYNTIQAFASYLQENYGGHFQNAAPKTSEIKAKVSSNAGKNKKLSINQPLEDIAVIGLSGKYPQADSIIEFWDVIKEGRNCITEVPKDHWEVDPYFNANKFNKDKTYSKWGGFIRDVDKFDPLFFQMSPLDAKRMDPQLRVLLESAWHAVEDAGYTPESLQPETVGVYVGVMNQDFTWLAAESYYRHGDYVSPGGYSHELANRISYILNFCGPSLTIETACSSSLTAIHMARMAILNGECDLAMAGGVNLSLHRSKYIMLSGMQILSDDGKERTFDANANGYVPGEGCGLVLLKRLSKAIEDGDHIYGVIKASAISHSGRGAGQYIPHVKSIAETMDRCIQQAGIHAEDLAYLETHGTGTSVGDPIELRGLANALQQYTDSKQYCALGSKANIGHLESASGICSLSKVLFNLRHKQIPLCVNIDENNPGFPLEESPFFIPKETQAWQSDKKRLAGINSFGLGGSGGFLLVEEYNESIQQEESHVPELIVLSAQSEAGLKRNVAALHAYLSNIESNYISPKEKYTLSNIAYTLQLGRRAMRYRLAFVVQNKEDMQKKLLDYLNNATSIVYKQGEVKANQAKQLERKELEEFSQLHHEWKANKKLELLANYWVKGQEINWETLHKNKQRISLPGYSFARDYHWVSELVDDESVVADVLKNEEKHDISQDVYSYQPIWETIALPEKANLETGLLWLITDRNSEKITVELRQQFNGKVRQILFKNLPEIVSSIKDSELPRYVIYQINSNYEIDVTFYAVFNVIKQFLQHRPKCKIDFLYCYDLQSEKSYFAEGLAGLFKTAAQEHPMVRGKVLGVDRSLRQKNKHFVEIILKSLFVTQPEIRCKNNNTSVKKYEIINSLEERKNTLIKSSGVYLITGGLGGIGLVFAKYLAENFQAKLILIGRSRLDEVNQLKLQELKQFGAEVLYEQADVSVKLSLERVMQSAKARFGQLNGIFHCAGVNKDTLILNKTIEECKQVLAPKLDGTLILDELTKHEQLDFFILFSSISSVFGNIGQGDYAYANGFMDAFAKFRDDQRTQGKRTGKTISINWPLWAEGGMQVDRETVQWMQHSLGMSMLSKEEALIAFEKALNFSPQFVVMKGEQQKLERALGYHYEDENIISSSLIPASLPLDENDILFNKLRAQIIKIVSELLKIKVDQLDADQDLSEYGMDSIVIMSFINEINKNYSLSVTPAIMFEHATLSSFVKYLMANHIKQIALTIPSYTLKINNNSHAKINPYARNTGQAKADHSIDSLNTLKGDIAVIGMGAILPGANNVNEFWDNLISEKDCIRELPAERWNWMNGIQYHEKEKIIKHIGLVEDINKFDADFFNISPREAELMDPQQRLFLEVVWNTVEDAGYTPSQLTKTGLFVGVCTNDYFEMLQTYNEKNAHVSTGVAHSLVANRISFLFNWKGPSIAVDTACSSSLVAIDYALKALLAGDCDVAIAGGVNAILSPTLSMSFNNAGMLSEDGKCKTFDKSANGYVRGEGAGAILLKPLSKALEDGDQIYGVIKASAVNHGGHVSSLTVPNPNAQAELITTAYKRASIDPETVSYIETHGTGTPLGDPIEINGLKKAFDVLKKERITSNNKMNYCGLGSVKSNIGHLEGAAGIASVIKVLLAMKHKALPANMNFQSLNPYIELNESPFYIVSSNQVWEHMQGENGLSMPYRAGVSSFGFGGTNAHIVIEENFSNTQPYEININQNHLMVLSAKSEKALYKKLADLKSWLEKSADHESPVSLENLCFTLNIGRVHFDWRVALVINSVGELKETLNELVQQKQPFNSTPIKEINPKFKHNPILKNLSEYLVKEINNINSINDYREKLISIGTLFVEGYDIDLNLLNIKNSKRRIALPTYPFEKKVFYMKKTGTAALNVQFAAAGEFRHTVNNQIVLAPLSLQSHKGSIYFSKTEITKQIEETKRLMFQFELIDLQENSALLSTHITLENICIREHIVYGEHVLPTDAIIEMIYITGKILFKDKVFYLSNVQLLKPIILAQGDIRKINVLIKDHNNKLTIAMFSALENEHETPSYHLKGEITFGTVPQDLKEKLIFNDKDQITLHDELMNKEGIYVEEFYHSLKSASLSEDSVTARIEQSARSKKYKNAFITNVSTVDALVGLGLLYSQKKAANQNNVFLPIGFEKFAIIEALEDEKYFACLKVLSKSDEKFVLDLELYSLEGIRKAYFEKLEIRMVDKQKLLISKSKMEAQDSIVGKPDKVVQVIKKIISEILYVEENQINEKRSFVELGMDSVLGIEFTKKIESNFGVKINNTVLYSSPNVSSFAKHLVQEYPEVTQSLATTENVAEERSEKTFVNLVLPNSSKLQTSDIAVVGISGRFPDAANVNDYWSNLATGINSIREIPIDRWDANEFYDSTKDSKDKTYSKVGAFIKDIDLFDPYFFNITPYEAQIMEPKQRIFLEEAWKAIEDAGYNENMLSKVKCGVFVGASSGDYDEILTNAGLEKTAQAFTGLSNAILASRISYFLNLKGPSLSVDTACSSSLVAIHLARESILSNECDVAITGGVSLLLTPRGHIMTAKAGMLSSSSLCRPFDRLADGILLGEGVGVLVLKRLENAIKDNNQIYGIIKASGINQDGTTNGITAPNPDAQYDLILDVCNKAKINPEEISYVEAHGTGTPLGDPIEFSALMKAYRKFTSKNQYCALGSVKANIGHTGMAAGVAGVVKVLMAMKNKQIPALINYREPNEQFDLKHSPFYINTTLDDWSVGSYPRIAAVSSFGFSGTNSHIIIAEGTL